jgi:hypothetical protein
LEFRWRLSKEFRNSYRLFIRDPTWWSTADLEIISILINSFQYFVNNFVLFVSLLFMFPSTTMLAAVFCQNFNFANANFLLKLCWWFIFFIMQIQN